MNKELIYLVVLILFFILTLLFLKLFLIILNKRQNNKQENFIKLHPKPYEFKEFVHSINYKISKVSANINSVKTSIDRLYKEKKYYPKNSKFYISLDNLITEKQKELVYLKESEQFLEKQLSEYVIKHESYLDELKNDYFGDYIQWKQFVKKQKDKYLSSENDLTK